MDAIAPRLTAPPQGALPRPRKGPSSLPPSRKERAIFPHLSSYLDAGLVFLRLMAGLVFAGSGYQHVRDPVARAKSIELPVGLTVFVGIAELAGGIAVIAGMWPQLASIGLILIMLGAIQKKVFSWKTGFWGKDGLGWNYELIMISMLVVILLSDGGRYVLLR